MENPMAALLNSQPSNIRFLVCRSCRSIHETDLTPPNMPPSACPSCGQTTERMVTMPSREKAELLLAGMPARSEPPKPSEPPVAEKPVAPAPAKAPEAAPEKVEPAVEQKVRKPRAIKSQVVAPTPSPEPVVQAVKPVTPTTAAPNPAHEAKIAAIKTLAEKFGLNEIEYKPVGTATVFSRGFTEWETRDGQRFPEYTILEPGIDTPESYREALLKARRKSGTVTTDVAQLTDFPEDLAPIVFHGKLIASTLTPTGPIKVEPGEVVSVLARLQKGMRGVLWCVRKNKGPTQP